MKLAVAECLFIFPELDGNTVGIVYVEIACSGFGIADIGWIPASADSCCVYGFKIVGGKADEETLALKVLALRHGDQLDLSLTISVCR